MMPSLYAFSKVILVFINAVCGGIGVFLAWLSGSLFSDLRVAKAVVALPFYIRQTITMLREALGVDILHGVAAFMLTVGIIVLLVCILGLTGTLLKNRLLLIGFIMILAVLIVTELGLIGFVMTGKTKLRLSLETHLTQTIPLYKGAGLHYQGNYLVAVDEKFDIVSYSWDYLHIQAECCGVNGTRDWLESFNGTYALPGDSSPIAAEFPLSCCQTTSQSRSLKNVSAIAFTNSQNCLRQSTSVNNQGCLGTIFELLWNACMFPTVIVGIIIGIQVLEILCTMCLLRGKRTDAVI